jgi:hypothetical protein
MICDKKGSEARREKRRTVEEKRKEQNRTEQNTEK